MAVNRQTVVFFDASCLIAGACSPEGGSGFLLDVCRKEFLRPAISQIVLWEAERNIRQKLDREVLLSFYEILHETPFLEVPATKLQEEERGGEIVEKKDEHVVHAVLAMDIPYLITLDRDLKENLNSSNVPFESYTPGKFIRTVLIEHKEYPDMRDT